MQRAWTRPEVASQLGITAPLLRSWERRNGVRPSQPGQFQTSQAALYSTADVTMLQVMAHAHSIGMAGEELTDIWTALGRVRRYLTKGWSGIIVTTTTPDAYLIGPGQVGPPSVDAVVANLPDGVVIRTVTRVEAPR